MGQIVKGHFQKLMKSDQQKKIYKWIKEKLKDVPIKDLTNLSKIINKLKKIIFFHNELISSGVNV